MRPGRFVTAIAALALVAVSCGIEPEATGALTPALTGDTADDTAEGASNLFGVSATPRPRPIRDGLNTFSGYEWQMEMATIGPTADETTTVSNDLGYSEALDATFTRARTVQTGPDFDGAEETITELYAVAGETCQFDGEEWSYDSATSEQQDAVDFVTNLFDVTIVPDNPVEVGPETIGGMAATHYRFSVSGFGSVSGALVTANQVDYWVSNDNVLLKYELVLESRSGPESDPSSEVYRVEASAELVSADPSLQISLPPDCLAQSGGGTTTTSTSSSTTTTTTTTTPSGSGGGLPPGTPYADYADLTDDSGRISVSVPSAWDDVAGTSWVRDGNPIGIALSASPDRRAYFDTWGTPGVFLGSTDQLGLDLEAYLDTQQFNVSCTYAGREDYSDPLYDGFKDTWVDCGPENSVFQIVAVLSTDGTELITVQVLAVTQADLGAADNIFATFIADDG